MKILVFFKLLLRYDMSNSDSHLDAVGREEGNGLKCYVEFLALLLSCDNNDCNNNNSNE